MLPEDPFASFDDYAAAHDGGAGLDAARAAGPDRTIAAITDAGLRGRGGAGFPAGRKWASIRTGGAESGERYVVANGAEGEPGTFKDRALLASNPYQVLEGLQIAAETIGAAHAFVAVKRSFASQIEALDRASREMTERGLLGSIPITIVTGPDEYLFGEETGLLEVVEGNDPLPRTVPPYLMGLFATTPPVGWSAGVEVTEDGSITGSNPTLVSNVETLANVPLILARGADWYRSVGTAESPGTVIATVVGDVQRAGVAEVDLGTPLSEVIVGIGGGVRAGRHFKAALSGVANPVLTAAEIDTPLSYESMQAVGSGMGACGFIVYDDTADMAAVARMVSRFLYVESCGQCPACKFGTGEVTAYLENIVSGAGDERDIELIGARLTTVTDANRCYLGTQEQRVISSLLRAFPEDFVAHLEGAGSGPLVPVPKLLDIVSGVAVYDSRQELKQPDWTFASS
ncbi:MAG: NADH-ubiquinone oxidoreductase-F iron-sulfur binding region domain-containing protein [Acidimicrobiia bacterium]